VNDSVDDIIKEIAVKHGIALGRDDPIMVLHTMMVALGVEFNQKNEEARRKMLDQYKEELEGMAKRFDEASKSRAERILNAALEASTKAMADRMDEGAKSTVGAVRQEVALAFGQLNPPIAQARWLALLNLASAAITIAAVVFAVWMIK
jgi:hypothetical protein